MHRRTVEWEPSAVGLRFATTNAAYTEKAPSGPFRVPRSGQIVRDSSGKFWRVVIKTNGAGEQFFGIEYCVLFSDRTKSQWVPEHVVSKG